MIGVGLKAYKSGKYTVKSMYTMLTSNDPNRSFRHLRKVKIPLKIKILVVVDMA